MRSLMFIKKYRCGYMKCIFPAHIIMCNFRLLIANSYFLISSIQKKIYMHICKE
jgi:hypothetical protein